ncbi:MAG: hypothetical protein QW818_04050, partial [Candidatus Aenigmatarchaeota archaeon]
GQKSYDTTKTTNGSHSLKAKLILNDKSVIESKQITIEVDNRGEQTTPINPFRSGKTIIAHKDDFFYKFEAVDLKMTTQNLINKGNFNIIGYIIKFSDSSQFPVYPNTVESSLKEVVEYYYKWSRGKLNFVSIFGGIHNLPFPRDDACNYSTPKGDAFYTKVLNHINRTNPIPFINGEPPIIILFADFDCKGPNLFVGYFSRIDFKYENKTIRVPLILIDSARSIGGWGKYPRQFSSTIAHELGHFLALGHSNFWQCLTDNIPCGEDSLRKYGDVFSLMGGVSLRNGFVGMNGTHLYILEWLKPNEVEKIQINRDYNFGHYILKPLDSLDVTGLKLLILSTPIHEFYIQYSQDKEIGWGNAKNGATMRTLNIHLEKNFPYDTSLYDISASYQNLPDLKSVALEPGEVWQIPTPPKSNYSTYLRVASATPQGLELEILKPKVEIISPTNGEKISERITKIPLITNITTPEAPKNFIENVTIEIQGGEGSGYQNAEVIKPEMFTSCTMLGSNQAYSGKGPSQCENKPVEWDTTHLQDGYYILKAKLYEKNEQDPIAESEPVVVIKGSSGFVESASTCAYVVPILYDNELGIYTPQAGEYSDIFDSKDCQYKVLTCFGRTLTNPQGCCQEKDKKTGQSTPCLPVNYLPNY